MHIYLDNAATTFPKPECVYEAVNSYMRNNGVSPGRGNYAKALEAEQLVYETRKTLAKFLGAKRPSQIVFTGNATESINLVLKGFLNQGDHVLTTNIEHNAMWRPLKNLEQTHGVTVEQFHCTASGSVDMQEIKDKLERGIKLLAVVHGSNVLGNTLPVSDIVRVAHQSNVPVLVDAAQTAGVYPTNIDELGVDFLAFTGHKGLLGLTGTGGLYIREGFELRTLKEGGTGSMAKSPFQPSRAPDRFEAGTMNIVGLAGLCASVKFLLDAGVSNVREHEKGLTHRLLDGLKSLRGIIVYGPESVNKRLGLVSFNIRDMNPYQVASTLDSRFGIMVRAGLHCAPEAHRLIGTDEIGAVRASVGYFNTTEHIDSLLEALSHISKGCGV